MKDFKLPDLGEGISAGDVVQVLVKEGDTITSEQPVVEIETDKAVVEVPCPFGGRIAKVHVRPGQKVQVGAPLVSLDEAGDGQAAGPKAEAPTQASGAASAGATPAAQAADAETAEPPEADGRAAPPSRSKPEAAPPAKPKAQPRKPEEVQPEPAARTPVGTAAKPPSVSEEPLPAGPATRRLARELGVELSEVAAANPGVRLSEEHVKNFVRERSQAMREGPGSGAPGVRVPPLPDFAHWGPINRVPLSSLQRKTAEQLHVAWVTAPHVTHFDQADITALEALRKRFKGGQEKGKPEVRLTVTAFIIKALTVVLKEYPQFNSSLDLQGGQLVLKRYYHIGVAVDTEAGLIVPVLRDADRKRILEIAAEMSDLAERTRKRKIGLDELKGGTFTVTNLGGIGGTAFTPIINYPEVAILGLARSREEPVIRDGELATRLMLTLCLSYDHRVVNGADAARFTRRLVTLLEDPELLLLEG